MGVAESSERGRSKGWFIGVLVGLVVLGVAVAVMVLRSVFLEVVRGREVGPDAEEMAKDPVLHLELGNAEPRGDITTRTGKEGGLVPAQQSDVSSAYQVWYVSREEGQELLAEAVEEAAGLGVNVWSLRCSEGSVGNDFSYRGAKQVSAGDETVVAEVSISLNIDPQGEERSRPQIAIWLSSDGNADTIEPSERDDGRISGDCPVLLLDAFHAAR